MIKVKSFTMKMKMSSIKTFLTICIFAISLLAGANDAGAKDKPSAKNYNDEYYIIVKDYKDNPTSVNLANEQARNKLKRGYKKIMRFSKSLLFKDFEKK